MLWSQTARLPDQGLQTDQVPSTGKWLRKHSQALSPRATKHPDLPGTVPVLALKVRGPRKCLNTWQSGTVGHLPLVGIQS